MLDAFIPATIRKPERQRRRVHFKAEDFEKYVYTDGWLGCRAKRSGTVARGHSDVCRKRIEQKLSEEENVR
jgi:hypothetical protein